VKKTQQAIVVADSPGFQYVGPMSSLGKGPPISQTPARFFGNFIQQAYSKSTGRVRGEIWFDYFLFVWDAPGPDNVIRNTISVSGTEIYP
jgi:hypothetical protein